MCLLLFLAYQSVVSWESYVIVYFLNNSSNKSLRQSLFILSCISFAAVYTYINGTLVKVNPLCYQYCNLIFCALFNHMAQDKLFYNGQCLDACPVRTYASRNGRLSARFGENPRQFYSKCLWSLMKVIHGLDVCVLFLLLLMIWGACMVVYISIHFPCMLFIYSVFLKGFLEIRCPTMFRPRFGWIFLLSDLFWLTSWTRKSLHIFCFLGQIHKSDLGSECNILDINTCSSILQVHPSSGQCL